MLSFLRSGQWDFKRTGPQRAQGKRTGRAHTPRSGLLILGDIVRYLLIGLISITQATTKIKTHYRNLSIDHVPHQGREGCTKTRIQGKDSCPNTSLRVQALRHLWFSMAHPRQSTAKTTGPSRSYPKIRGICPNTEIPSFCEA